jgi:putative ABC transport system substrate-binding protein
MLAAMRRRDVLLGLAACAGLARAQAPAPRWRIGYLGPSAETAPLLLQAFKDGLAEKGYVDGRNVVIDYRWTNVGTGMNTEVALAASARELVANKADVIVASIDPAILAATRATRTIPIVMLNSTDPVALGVVESISRPGGNVTGFSNVAQELVAKRLQVLVEVVPTAKRIALLVGVGTLRGIAVNSVTDAAKALSVSVALVEAPTPAAFDEAFATMRRQGAQAMMSTDTGGGIFFTQRARLAELALKGRLPSMFANIENVQAGGLMSYSPNSIENYRGAALFIDKILKGARPATIPVEQPTRFDLTINMKTAQALGIVIPADVKLRANLI